MFCYCCFLSLSDKVLEKSKPRSGLMERLRSRCGQHKSWTDSVKAIRMAIANVSEIITLDIHACINVKKQKIILLSLNTSQFAP
jgi:hypothetical protein